MSPHATNPDTKILPKNFNRQVGQYAIAAAVAGVSVLALTEPAAAEVVVTKKTIQIPVSTGTTANPVTISLANNGVTDISLTLWAGALPGRTLDFNSPNESNGALAAGSAPYAVALTRGAKIGPVGSEARFFYFRGLVELSASSGVNKYCKGFWGSNPKYYLGVGCGEEKNQYVGVRFLLNGQTHYGWIRLTVTTSPDPNGPALTAKITGYAYETVANKPILAGTAATSAAEVQVPEKAQHHAGPSLGMLAGGVQALPLWRREETSVHP